MQALHRTAAQNGYDARILAAVEEVNYDQKSVLLRKLVKQFGEDLSGRTFAIWGLSFKPNTDDMREAPSIVIIKGLLERGAKVVAHDPIAMHEASQIFAGEPVVRLVDEPYMATENADALLIVTEWKVYRAPDFARLKQQLKQPLIFDGRNIYEPELLREAGFSYFGIGRSSGATS